MIPSLSDAKNKPLQLRSMSHPDFATPQVRTKTPAAAFHVTPGLIYDWGRGKK